MDINDVYSWLNRSRKCESEIRRMQNKIEELKCCLLTGGIDYSKDRVQSTPEDSMSKIFAEIDETERMIREKSLERGYLVSEISNEIEKLDSDLEKNILADFFIARKSASQIAKEMSYDVSWINKLKKEGIKKLCFIIADYVEESSEKKISMNEKN